MSDFEAYLRSLKEGCTPSRTVDAMFYSLLGGGKRVRPRLLFAALRGYGLPEQAGYPCAAAIEMIHTYSLIHDDLPAMDDDTLRRGRKTCHIAFDEATAILAGDGLLTDAFSIVLRCACTDAQKVKLVSLLSEYSGSGGMILGQTLDIAAEAMQELDRAQLEEIHLDKTGCLLTLPLLCAAVLAGHKEDLPILKQIGSLIGLSFQIQDDVMDVTESQQQLGKSNSDIANHKATFVTLMGVEDARALNDACYREAKALCAQLHLDTQGLLSLFDQLRERRS